MVPGVDIVRLANRRQAAFGHRSCHLAISPITAVRVPPTADLLLMMQSSHTLGATWTGAKGVRLSRIFMFPVKSAGHPNAKSHAAWRPVSFRA